VHNALTLEMWRAIETVLRSPGTGVRCAVIHGAGKSFCSGGDLPQLASIFESSASIGEFRRVIARAFSAISNAEFPVIAAVDGVALGGGAEIALACDLRFATSRAKFAMPGVRFGLGLNAREIERLVELVGPSRATSWLLTGATIDASTAHGWGLVDEVVDEPLTTAMRYAATVAQNSEEVTRWTKGVIESRAEPAALENADDRLRQVGLRAVLERRPNDVQGRDTPSRGELPKEVRE
jgi:enoyl-CoA hydratase/carnithine racemase